MRTAAYENAIKARVETVTPRVFVSEVPSNTTTPKYPYVVLYFGGPVRTARDHHITSSKNDTMIGYLTVQVVSETDSSARDVADNIRVALAGFIPPNCGEMVCEGGLSYSNGTNTNPPHQVFQGGWVHVQDKPSMAPVI